MKWFAPATPLPSPYRLGIGPGPGPRMLSLGAPNNWIPFQGGLACGEPEGLFVLYPNHVEWFPTPGPLLGITPWGSNHIAAVFEQKGAFFWAVMSAKGPPLPPPEVRSWFPITERYLLAPTDTGTIHETWVPDGALHALKTPLWGHPGMAWLDQRTLYRGLPGGRVTVSGSVPFEPFGILSGPNGSAFVWGEEASALAPPQGPPIFTTHAPQDAMCRFDITGQTVWAHDGEMPFGLSTNGPASLLKSPRSPLGTSDHPWTIDIQNGRLHGPSEQVVLSESVVSSIAFDDSIIVGPAASIWCRHTGQRMAEHPAMCGDEISIEGSQILIWFDDECRVFDRQGRIIGMSNQQSLTPEPTPGMLDGQQGRWILGDMGLALWIPHDSSP